MLHGQLARVLDGDPVGDRVQVAADLDADEADARPERAQGDRDSRGEPAAADRDQHRLDVGHLLGELEPDRPLSRDHVLVLEGVDEGGARLLDALERLGERVVEALAGQDGLAAVGQGRVDLRHRRVGRHVDRRVDAELARRPGDRLAVVAGARRDHPGGPLLGREGRKLVERAANLERARALEVLRLEHARPAGLALDRLGGVNGRHARVSADPLASGLDVSDRRSRLRRQFGTPFAGSRAPPSADRASAGARPRATVRARGRWLLHFPDAGVLVPRRPQIPRRRGCRARRSSSSPAASSAALCASIAAHSSSIPSPRSASVLTIGGTSPEPSASICRTSATSIEV